MFWYRDLPYSTYKRCCQLPVSTGSQLWRWMELSMGNAARSRIARECHSTEMPIRRLQVAPLAAMISKLIRR